MIKIAICDDDALFTHKLKTYLEKNINIEIDVCIYYNGFDLIDNIYQFDFIFLDYDMPLLNGFEILEKLEDTRVKKIIISNYDYIVFDTYKYEIYWFIRKKYLQTDIKDLIEKIQIYPQDKNKRFHINSFNKILDFPFDEINYIDTHFNYIYLHTKNNTYKIRATFASIKEQFLNENFIVPTYGILINMKYIKFIDFAKLYVIMYNDILIGISRNQKNEVKEKYAKFNNSYF